MWKNIFNDSRLDSRAEHCFKLISENPSQTFPNIFKDQKDLTAFYRFMNNSKVNSNIISDAVTDEVIDLISENEIVVAHDTTEIKPKSKEIDPFIAHFSIAIDSQINSRVIYGPTNLLLFGVEKFNKTAYAGTAHRWKDAALSTQEKFSNKRIIHLMDREGDKYDILSTFSNKENCNFVIRSKHDRRILKSDYSKISEKIQDEEIIINRLIEVSKRKPSPLPDKKKNYPPRPQRKARLGIRASSMTIKKAEHSAKDLPPYLELNVVDVKEIDPMDEKEAIHSRLITSLPINSADEVLRVVDLYRKRWIIEEFFKALKTGCKLEHRQFEDLESWFKLTTLLTMIAVKIVNLRNIDNTSEIDKVFTSSQIKILKKYSKNKNLSTVVDFQDALAKLGGHIKSNGPPGWQVLSRAFEELIKIEKGWILRGE